MSGRTNTGPGAHRKAGTRSASRNTFQDRSMRGLVPFVEEMSLKGLAGTHFSKKLLLRSIYFQYFTLLYEAMKIDKSNLSA